MIRAFSANDFSSTGPWGAAPGWYDAAPLALKAKSFQERERRKQGACCRSLGQKEMLCAVNRIAKQ